ncbi:hypothetical protein AAEJ42_10780, partial [Shewanella algae]|uniref:hypothetical protein n=1 Tax=Shewanella algae TaxID=38313 RepID=UPI00313D40FA
MEIRGKLQNGDAKWQNGDTHNSWLILGDTHNSWQVSLTLSKAKWEAKWGSKMGTPIILGRFLSPCLGLNGAFEKERMPCRGQDMLKSV